MSKLKLAKNMLSNLHVGRSQLENMLAECEDTLANSVISDSRTLEEYKNVVSRLRDRISITTYGALESQYMLPRYVPANLEKGMHIWVNLDEMRKIQKNQEVYVGKNEEKKKLKLTAGIDSNWIGDFEVVRVENGSSNVIAVEPIKHLTRISKLYGFFQKEEYRPSFERELFWTNFTPKSVDDMSGARDYHHRSIVQSINRASNLVKVDGFVIFVKGMNEHILENIKPPYDFVYTGTNESGKSGMAIYIQRNPIRDSVNSIIAEHIKQQGAK